MMDSKAMTRLPAPAAKAPPWYWNRWTDMIVTAVFCVGLLAVATHFNVKPLPLVAPSSAVDAGTTLRPEDIVAIADSLPVENVESKDEDTSAPITAQNSVFAYLGICSTDGTWVKTNFEGDGGSPMPRCSAAIPPDGLKIRSTTGAKYWDSPPLKNGVGETKHGAVVATRRAATDIKLIAWAVFPLPASRGLQVCWGKVAVPPAAIAKP